MEDLCNPPKPLGIVIPKHTGKGDNHNTNIHKYVMNVNKTINELKAKVFLWVQCLWDYMVVKASLRSHIIHHDQSGLSRPNHIFTT